MAVHPHEERTGDALTAAVFVDRLADGSHVVIVETAIQRASAMP